MSKTLVDRFMQEFANLSEKEQEETIAFLLESIAGGKSSFLGKTKGVHMTERSSLSDYIYRSLQKEAKNASAAFALSAQTSGRAGENKSNASGTTQAPTVRQSKAG